MEKAVSQLVNRLSISWQMLLDRLKGLRKEAWLDMFLGIKKEIEQKAKERFIGEIVTLSGSLTEDVFVVRTFAQSTSPKPSKQRKRFVMGKSEELRKITDRILRNYQMEIEIWEDTPILRFSRGLDGEKIEVGIKAPIREYGKAYRIWIRANGVHMYPTKPVQTGRKTKSWVFRAYHTKNWKEKLIEILEHGVEMEDHTLSVIKAARKIDVKDVQALLGYELLVEEREEIIDRWKGGSLWDLAEEVSKINRAASLAVLKKQGLLKEEF